MNTAAFLGLATALFASQAYAAPAPQSPAKPTYILNGFRLSGVKGVNTDELIAKLKDKEDARITEDDIAADTKVLGEELKARHIIGQLFATMAEKDGRVWVLYDFQPDDAPD